jgi:sulfatase modifying factor 1
MAPPPSSPRGLIALIAVVLAVAAPACAKSPLKPGATLRDCPKVCPELVVVPAGAFTMGSPVAEAGRDADEEQQHRVTISYAFAVGKYDVTRDEYAAFALETKVPDPAVCNIHPAKGGWPGVKGLSWHHTPFAQAGRHPVVCISWQEAGAYAQWLSRKTGREYRLLSEAEWEYAARAGTTTAAYWGDSQDAACAYANGVDYSLKGAQPDFTVVQHCRDGYAYTSPVGSFGPNAFGLYDMMGDVFQMLADRYVQGYAGAPTDGSPRLDGGSACRINRGGSWTSTPGGLRAAARACDNERTTRVVDLGFRVARRL